MTHRFLLAAGAALALSACTGASVPDASAVAADAGPVVVADSVSADDQDHAAELAAFQAPLPRPDTLSGGLPSRDALVHAFVEAVEAGDTAAVVRMAITRPEFGWLYYPHTEHVRGRGSMEPELLWYLMLRNGEKGINRVMGRYAGKRLGFQGYACDPLPREQGPVKLWENCQLRLTGVPTQAGSLGVFGSILEHEGRFKFLSYANDL